MPLTPHRLKTLFVYWHGLGDNILATPAIRKYKQTTGNYVGWAMLRRHRRARLFDENPYIDQLHWISDAWNDFGTYAEGSGRVVQEGEAIKKKYGYDELRIVDHRSSSKHKILRTADEMGVRLGNDVHTEVYYDPERISALYDSVALPDEYVFFHGRTGVPAKDFSLARAEEWLRRHRIDLPIVSPDFTWDHHKYPIAFAMDVMRRAKHIVVADSVMYHAAHAMDLCVDLAYFPRGRRIWRIVHPLHSKKETVVYSFGRSEPMGFLAPIGLTLWNAYEALGRRLSRPKPPAPETISKVLLIRRQGIGNMALFIPTLREIRRLLPRARVTFYAKEPALALVRGSGLYDEERLDPNDLVGSGSTADLVATIRKIRAERYDLAMLSFPSNRTHVRPILQMSRARFVVGHNVWSRRRIFDRTLSYDPERHEIEANLDLLREAGLEADRIDVSLGLSDEERAAARAEFERLGLAGCRVVSMHMGILPGKFDKAWPLKNYVELARFIAARLDASILIIGGPQERDACDELASSLGERAVNTAGKLSIREVAGLVSSGSMHVGGDTGCAHVARSVGVPVLAIFGPTNFRRSRPWGDGSQVRVVRSGIECSPCMTFGFRRRRKCGLECLTRLSVDAVEQETLDFARSIGIPGE